MKKIFYLAGLLLPALCIASLTTMGQTRPPALVSPEVHTDHTVSFRFFARDAKKVELNTQFIKGLQPLTKDTAGIWSITLGPVKPDIYPYCFVVDGTQVNDPNNTLIFPNELFKNSLVEIPGDTALVHELQHVPHGKISYRYYRSLTLGETRPLVIYTPPGYNPNGSKKYPVLYLIHGGSDTQETWYKVGHSNLIADNLIARGKARPMIIVMPYANVTPYPREAFSKDMIDDIIPFVESNYRVLTDSRDRAIAGFSVGGGQTLNIGLLNTDKFAWVCAYAPYTATDEFKKNFTDWSPDAKLMNKELKLLTLSVGTEDFLYESVKKNIEMLKGKELNLETYFVSGGHTWMNCKLYLAMTLPRLFR